MLITIVNHNHTAQALQLAQRLRFYGEVVTLDSGSHLTPLEQTAFDVCLPNVYYCGLLNAAYAELVKRPQHTALYFICSDVEMADPATITLAAEAMRVPTIGVYAPSAWGAHQPQMRPRNTGGCRSALFAEGFCFAVQHAVVQQLCPIDTHLNVLGWGVDILLGYWSWSLGRRVLVDDRVIVRHLPGTGYSRAEARRQRKQWIAQQSGAAQKFHHLATWEFMKTELGPWVWGWLSRL